MSSKPHPIGIISMFYIRPFLAEHLALLPRMKRAGMDFVELLVPEPDELDLEHTRQALADAGLGVVLAARVNLERIWPVPMPYAMPTACATSNTAWIRRPSWAPMSWVARCTARPLVFAGRAPAPIAEDDRLARVDRVIGGLRQAGRYAQDKGIRLAVEPLNRFETDFVSSTVQGLDLVRRIDSKAVGLLLDPFT